MSHQIRIHLGKGSNSVVAVTAENNENLLEFLRSNSVLIDSECGGNGTCGKCRVRIIKRGVPEYVLACQYSISCDLDVFPQEVSKRAKIIVEGRGLNSLADIREKPTTGGKANEFGFAVDIGTTTLAVYFYNLSTKERVDARAELNPQRIYGADVISRIDYQSRSEADSEALHMTLVKALDRLFNSVVNENRLEKSAVSKLIFAGNTTMLHFLMDLPAAGLAAAPFTPVTVKLERLKASQLGFKSFQAAEAVIMPGVSAYVGADTVAAVLSSRLYISEEICLLLDMGTNGEIVLGSRDGMLSCSAAAGPAFEGANIECGSGSIEGAIDSVAINNGDIEFSVIGSVKPLSICGSGLVDAAAVMLKLGVINSTGRIKVKNEISSEKIRRRLIEIDGSRAFLISDLNQHSETGMIYITQKDIRELQKAKAAIYAGIETLTKKAGIKTGDIKKVFLAGGFGSMMNPQSAVDIGLLPKELGSRIEALGNAAGQGAVECLVNEEALETAKEISQKINNIELSNTPEFIELYIDSMGF